MEISQERGKQFQIGTKQIWSLGHVGIGFQHKFTRFNRTLLILFYKRGWRGINIDAMPGLMKRFVRVRPRDINIECGVAGHAGKLHYHRFSEPASNTFDAAEAKLKNRPPYELIDTVEIEARPLDALLARHLPPMQQIDFLSADVEGKDYEVLRSNDWERFRPRFTLTETLRTDMLHLSECPVVKFLGSVGYHPIAKAYNATFFAFEGV